MSSGELQIPVDFTYEEAVFLEIVKQRMLQKLNDRHKFIFLYCIEMGHPQNDAASVLGVSKALIARHMERIREILSPHRSE